MRQKYRRSTGFWNRDTRRLLAGFVIGILVTVAYFAYVEHAYPVRIVGLLTPPSPGSSDSSATEPVATARTTEYLKCRTDYREYVPDYLDEAHRFFDAFCKAYEKAQIPPECPGARQRSDSFANAFGVDYELSLSPDDRLRVSLQVADAMQYLPEHPEICSEEWINERLSS